ncbi:zinc-dependent metalloprotease [Spelaeicoccus albus]|uniref:Coenzyme F420 biosynthesis associated uncharacterized protein n=1 Tax=Spelaeicoccus albus TaxID=1280376 RepID=A0A7Z0D5T9_9MICO|nr:zinc-dependent metalloprotease [Spelaeicoccus albus]NYI69437.1 coenzyme F420 biosynthesis associated uncharacterized protein [Spelaeicoccus albus]
MPDSSGSRADQMIDFDFAWRTANELLPAGPSMSPSEREAHVSALREAAEIATAHVQRVSGLDVDEALERDTSVLVVDRSSWAKANTQSFRTLLEAPIAAALDAGDKSSGVGPVSRRTTGAELGAMLAFLGTRVLGQYEPFAPGGGRLLLVAPTIASVAQRLDVDHDDFRLWVCLHEETHRVQFAAAPWLAAHVRGRIDSLGEQMLGTVSAADRLRQIFRKVPEVFGPGGTKEALDLVSTPQSSLELDRLTAIMSLLEGHADVVMDEVGPEVIPTVEHIRSTFNAHRSGHGGIDGLIRKFLGLEAKMRQYKEGAAFVRAVVARVGFAGLNRVWLAPEYLPEPDEIAEPDRWLRRVL